MASSQQERICLDGGAARDDLACDDLGTHRPAAGWDRGFAVLAFPCNQFGGQEPGTEEEIGAFCRQKYGVSFSPFAKIDVNGKNAHPLYRMLKERQPGLLGFFGGGKIRWNFTKFLVDRQGNVVERFGSSKTPRVLAGKIESLLNSG
jgi:glutathione peroxidase